MVPTMDARMVLRKFLILMNKQRTQEANSLITCLSPEDQAWLVQRYKDTLAVQQRG